MKGRRRTILERIDESLLTCRVRRTQTEREAERLLRVDVAARDGFDAVSASSRVSDTAGAIV
jgi:hypothetical protein